MGKKNDYYGVSKDYNNDYYFYKNINKCIRSISDNEISTTVILYEPSSKSDILREINKMVYE